MKRWDIFCTVVDNFDELIRVANDGDMPTWLYRTMHPSSRLSVEEKSILIRWAQASAARL